jgi:hypothetical protein
VRRGAVCALALAAALGAGGCRKPARSTVERVTMADGPAAAQLAAGGLDREAVERTTMRIFDGATGFVRAADARSSDRRYEARVVVHRAEPLSGAGGGASVVHVILAVELAPATHEPSLHEAGRAAEPVGAGPGAVRAALARATEVALEKAVQGFALQLAAEQKSTGDLVKDLSSPDAPVRDHAVRVLADRGEHNVVPALVSRLRDPDPAVVERAVGALAQLRDGRAVLPLIELSHHRDGPFVANMARVLGDIGGPEAQAWLLTMSSGHPDDVVRGAAREALAEMQAREPHANAAGR